MITQIGHRDQSERSDAGLRGEPELYRGVGATGSANAPALLVAGQKAKLASVRNVSTCSRISSAGVHHNATWVVMKDMTEYVFDWHPTLNTRKPLISRRADWGRCQGEVEFTKFPGSGWK